MNNLQWLQNFYSSRCNGDWEHTWGIKIDTLDNPGWRMIFDLEDTFLESKKFEEVNIERSNNDWIVCKVKNRKFDAAGGPKNLDEIITIFKEWTASSQAVL